MAIEEIVLPETEPETEWILGRPVRKMSPRTSHSLLQRAMATALQMWPNRQGQVGTEWRFRVAPPNEPLRPLVPDVAYVAYDRLRPLTGDDAEVPPLAPDVAVEILSPGDRRQNVDHKIDVYLAAGSLLVMIVHPETRSIELHDRDEMRVLSGDDAVMHPALPGFSLALEPYFREMDLPPA